MALKLYSPTERIVVSDADLVEDGDPGTTYTVQLVARDMYQKVSAKHAMKYGGRRGMKLDEQMQFLSAVSDELLLYALVDWSGVLFEGQPAPCDDTHKRLLDGARVQALLAKAGVNQTAGEEASAASFRSPSALR